MHNVKDTKEALIGVNELGLATVKVFADGVQFQDFMELWKRLGEDEAFKATLMAAYQGWNNISKELSDLDVAETLDLVSVQVSYIPRFIELLGKPAPESEGKGSTPAK